eukprot:CAMPEP_0194528084 /NCGR_PEP_ID=MMETSP0253-20130528/64403_1 /TAXON_ID=2966 /ORGANISM="Noctiluca scintillans" /LENGTH=423 /DNA_ID=CAMNT_0039373107 /DNA_START=40 /DNA_END=1311 /DNA_ORIENTATION=-
MTSLGAFLALSWYGVQGSGIGDGYSTSVTNALMSMISRGSGGTYTGGKGVVVRDILDGLSQGPNVGVPGTFWSNDIFAVTQMYPDRVDLDDPTVLDIYNYASVGCVIGSAVSNLFYDFDNIQDPAWDYGVFYARDSNSVDRRCLWLDNDGMYDCPGGCIFWGEPFAANAAFSGTGVYPVGNPYANASWGGGAGCHFDMTSLVIDQLDEYDTNGENLVGDKSCQCNPVFKDNWGDWVSLFAKNTDYSDHELHGDRGICWVDNIKDMINLQNWLYWSRADWTPTPCMFTGSEEIEYMGWNEVPFMRTVIDDPTNWDAFVIKLPGAVCGGNGDDDVLECLDAQKTSRLNYRIGQYDSSGHILVGSSYIGTRPGSYAVVAKQYKDTYDNWFVFFFCQSWKPSSQPYQMVFNEITASDTYGACYIDYL